MAGTDINSAGSSSLSPQNLTGALTGNLGTSPAPSTQTSPAQFQASDKASPTSQTAAVAPAAGGISAAPSGTADTSSTDWSSILGDLGSFLGNNAGALGMLGLGEYEASQAESQTASLTSQLTGPAQPFVNAGVGELGQTMQGLTGAPVSGGSIGQQEQAAAELGTVATQYGTGQLTPAQQQQVQQQVQQQQQQIRAQLASQGITDGSVIAMYDQQIQDNATQLTQQLTQQNLTLAQTALGSVQTTYSNLLNQSISTFGAGMGPIEDAVQTTIQQNTAIANGLQQLFGNIAKGMSGSGSGGSSGLGGLLGTVGSALGKALGLSTASSAIPSAANGFVTGNPSSDMAAAINAGAVPSGLTAPDSSAMAGMVDQAGQDVALGPGGSLDPGLISVEGDTTGAAGATDATALGASDFSGGAAFADTGAAGASSLDVGGALGGSLSDLGGLGADTASAAAGLEGSGGAAAEAALGGGGAGAGAGAGALSSIMPIAGPLALAGLFAYGASQPAVSLGSGYWNGVNESLGTAPASGIPYQVTGSSIGAAQEQYGDAAPMPFQVGGKTVSVGQYNALTELAQQVASGQGSSAGVAIPQSTYQAIQAAGLSDVFQQMVQGLQTQGPITAAGSGGAGGYGDLASAHMRQAA